MSESTLFFSPQASAWADNVSDPVLSATTQTLTGSSQAALNARRTEQLELDDGDTRVVTIQGLANANELCFWMSVVGEARLETAALDTNGVTVINGYIPTYGTARFPGKVFLSTYNITAVTIRGLADSTKVEFGFFRAG